MRKAKTKAIKRMIDVERPKRSPGRVRKGHYVRLTGNELAIRKG